MTWCLPSSPASVVPKVVTAVLAVALAASIGILGTSSPAHAADGEVYCLYGYNYAGSDWLYAVSQINAQQVPEPCGWVSVEIRNGGCNGEVLAADSGWGPIVTSSVTLDSRRWISPCSRHGASLGYPSPVYQLSLPF